MTNCEHMNVKKNFFLGGGDQIIIIQIYMLAKPSCKTRNPCNKQMKHLVHIYATKLQNTKFVLISVCSVVCYYSEQCIIIFMAPSAPVLACWKADTLLASV